MTGFGTNTSFSSFGFGSNTQNPFGQTQRFGAPATSGFGNPTPAFGQTTTPMFGAPQQTAPLFGTPASTAPAFGTNTQNVFGTSTLFGQQSQPQPTTSLFGASSSTFGQPNKTSAFNFSSTPSTGLFGQTAAQQPQQQNVFQAPGTASMFGNTSFGTPQVQSGTCVKFVPVTGTDTMQKGGSSSMINTKHYSITFMKEYEGKSFEELRFEDYAANRKGPQQAPAFGAATPAFGATTPAFGAMTSSTPSMFGQPENKTVFGAQTSTFGQTPFGIGNQTSTAANLFGKTTTTFGAPVTSATSSFGFGTPSTNMFGSTQPAKPFGTQPAQPLFSQPSTGFGTNTLFGQPAATQQNTFFNKPAQPSFSTPQTSGFGFGQTPATNPTNTLFQTSKPSFSLFGQNTTTTANTFGQQQPTGFGGFNAFAKPAQTTFGQPTQTTGFGTGTGLQTNNLFGNIGAKPTFGTNNTSGLFMGSSMQPQNNAFSLQTQSNNQPIVLSAQTQSAELRTMFDLTDPYGFSPHLDGLSAIKKSDTHYSTNPKDIETVLQIQDKQATGGAQKNLRLCPPIASKNKWYLFESNFEKTDYDALNIVIKPSPKRLNLKNGPSKKPDPVVVYENGKIVGENRKISLEGLPNPFKIDGNKQSEGKKVLNASTVEASVETNEEPEKPEVAPTEKEVGKNATDGKVGSPVIRKEKQNTSTSEKIDTCGIICTRPEYYTIPAINEIAKFKNEDGTCVIKGFTIGRVGYGNVYFPEAMDVSNLNIDELVHFRYREICIYTDDDKKPPVGEGLNRKAQVTLDRVYPKKEKNRQELETDPQELMNNHFADSLKSVCLKSNTTFLDYRPETGSWVFNVPHFSKYGFLDSDEEDDEKMVVEENKKVPSNNALNVHKKSAQKQKKGGEQVSDQGTPDNAKKGLGGVPYTELDLETPMELGKHGFLSFADIPEDQKDGDNFFETSPFGNASAKLPYNYTITSVTDPIVDMNIQNIQSPVMQNSFVEVAQKNKSLRDYKELFYEDDYYQPPLKKITECLMNTEEGLDNLKVKSPVVRAKPKLKRYKLQNISMYVPLSRSMITFRAYMDTAMFKGRSFRVGWGRGFTMTALLGENFITEDNQVNLNPACVLLVDASFLQKSLTEEIPDEDPFMNHISDFMEVVRTNTNFTLQKDEDGREFIPHCVEKKGIKMLRELSSLSNDIAENHKGNVKMRYYANIWNLCMAFWDEIEDENYMDRRDLFNEWLESVTEPSVDEDLIPQQMTDESENVRKILVHLSGHQISKAVELCFKTNYPQLAMLLSQLSTTNFGRHCMQFQLNFWNTTSAADHIDPEVLKLYLLFSGAPFYKNINVCENFDWVRCLGIYFWYLVQSCKSVSYALDCYEQAVGSNFVEKPYPIYAKESKDTWDILFHIMKLFKNEKLNLDDLLSPLTHTDNQCDFRLSWLLYKAFLALPIGILSEKTKIELTTVFSAQLEQLGFFKWAVFVLLYLDDVLMRKQLVCGVLDRNITDQPSQIEKELVCNLKIPKEWIHIVKAYQSHQLENYWEAYKHLACSQMWYECSDVVIRQLAPNLVANDNFSLLKKLITPLPARDNHHEITVIIEFIRFWEILHEDADAIKKFSPSEVLKELTNFVHVLKHYPIAKYEQCMIVSEISKYCFKFWLRLLKNMKSTTDQYQFIQNFQYFSEQLVMPFDYRYMLLNKFVSFTKPKNI